MIAYDDYGVLHCGHLPRRTGRWRRRTDAVQPVAAIVGVVVIIFLVMGQMAGHTRNPGQRGLHRGNRRRK
ncbi:MAG: hypothetical protein R2856_01080 [Caldilineaceae bacterium]